MAPAKVDACHGSGEIEMFDARNQISPLSRWHFDGEQVLSFLTLREPSRVKIPAAVLGLTAFAMLTAALWSPFADATGGCRTSPLVFKPEDLSTMTVRVRINVK
jgi:hypothetical protein